MGNADGTPAGIEESSGTPRGSAMGTPAYTGHAEFKEQLHIPSLPPPDTSPEAPISLLFLLLDVSGSMHNKLQNAKEQICSKFVTSSDANVVAMMAFTTEPYVIVPVSGMSTNAEKQEFQKTVRSVFIPAHSGTNIPAALLRYAGQLSTFLDQVPQRSDLQMCKASCVVITDGLNKVTDASWEEVSEAVSSMRSRAKSKSCYVFFYLLNLQSSDVDEQVLRKMSQVLRAERAVRAGLQPLQVYDTISQHMVTLQRCFRQISEVKTTLKKMEREQELNQEEDQSGRSGQSSIPTIKAIEAKVQLVKVESKKLHSETAKFDLELKGFEEETKQLFKTQVQEFDQQMTVMRSSVHSNRDTLQESAAAALNGQYIRDIDRITRDLQTYEEFVKTSQVASEEMKEDLQEAYVALAEKEERLARILRENKSEQFDAGKLLARTQKQREKAYGLAKLMKMETELQKQVLLPSGERESSASKSGEEDATGTCGICFKSPRVSTAFALMCGHRSFCAECLATHVEAKANQSLPAYCPQDGCSHELLQDEVETAVLYQKRCTQRRIEPKDAKVICPRRCGNLACSRLDERSATCEKCAFAFCIECESRVHPEQPDCTQFLLGEIAKAETEGRQREDMQQRLQTLQQLKSEGNVRVCPRCKFAYQKVSGCDHMRCGKCRYDFTFDGSVAQKGQGSSRPGSMTDAQTL